MIDWRSSPWIAQDAAADETRRERHEAALAILDDYNQNGTPFALFLRAFAVRQLYCHASDGGDGGDGILLDVHFTRHLRARGANVIRVQDASHAIDVIGVPNETPALLLENETWLEAVRALIDASELIISECQSLSPGVLAELHACAHAGKTDRTVLVLPSPPFEFIGNEQPVQPFPRVIQQHDMVAACPARSPVFDDLIERMEAIAALDATARVNLIAERRLQEAVPVSFRGVADGLSRLAQRYAHDRNVGATYFMGSKAALAARAGGGAQPWVEALLTLLDLCERAGHVELAVTVADDVEAALAEAAELDAHDRTRLLDRARKRRAEVLGKLFEARMTTDRAQELWQLANAQGSRALERKDLAGFAQCLAWMAVAANLGGRYEMAADHARDAVLFAQQCGDRAREAFANVYLGHAHRGLGQLHDAAEAYGKAIACFDEDRYGRLEVVTFLSLAQVSEALGADEDVLHLYRSTREMAAGLGHADVEAAAVEGIERLRRSDPSGPGH